MSTLQFNKCKTNDILKCSCLCRNHGLILISPFIKRLLHDGISRALWTASCMAVIKQGLPRIVLVWQKSASADDHIRKMWRWNNLKRCHHNDLNMGKMQYKLTRKKKKLNKSLQRAKWTYVINTKTKLSKMLLPHTKLPNVYKNSAGGYTMA